MLRKVGTQVVKWTTEGAVKEDTWNYEISSILRREGIRQLPGICWYPVRAQEIVKQGGTAGNVYDPSLTEEDSVMGGVKGSLKEAILRMEALKRCGKK